MSLQSEIVEQQRMIMQRANSRSKATLDALSARQAEWSYEHQLAMIRKARRRRLARVASRPKGIWR